MGDELAVNGHRQRLADAHVLQLGHIGVEGEIIDADVGVGAHELGHALSMGHVDTPNSVMYYLMDEQPRPPVLSAEDKEAFEDLCGGNFLSRLLASVEAVYNNLVNN